MKPTSCTRGSRVAHRAGKLRRLVALVILHVCTCLVYLVLDLMDQRFQTSAHLRYSSVVACFVNVVWEEVQEIELLMCPNIGVGWLPRRCHRLNWPHLWLLAASPAHDLGLPWLTTLKNNEFTLPCNTDAHAYEWCSVLAKPHSIVSTSMSTCQTGRLFQIP